MKTILVTGKDSQLAKCIRDIQNNYLGYQFIYKNSRELDITNKVSILTFFSEYTIDFCINCAAYTAVDEAESNIKQAIRVNVLGPKNLAIICKKFNTVLIHISTDYVFDGESKTAYKPSDDTKPISVYGKSKREGELEIIKHLNKHFIIRTSWLYSEYGCNFMKTMIGLSIRGKEINVVNNQAGSPTYAKDLANFILNIISFEKEKYGIYHFSNVGQVSWFTFAKEIFKLIKSKTILNGIDAKDYPSKALRPNYSVLDISKTKSFFDLEFFDWKLSLKKAIKNFKMKNNLDIAISAALEAGKVIMEIYNSEIFIEYKDDNSPLTEADKRANDVINKHLIKTNIPIISEENKQTDYTTRKSWTTCWVVDPVDGTKEFIKRNGEFTVNIALVTNGKPELGVIYVPATKTIYVANVNTKEAFKSQLESHDASLEDLINSATTLKPKQKGSNPVQIVGSRSHMSPETLDFVESIKKEGKQVEVLSKGSSLKFCLVAEGNADVYPRFAPTMEWDTAAGQAICNAVGIDVISQETNKSLLYNKENLLNPWFLVSKN